MAEQETQRVALTADGQKTSPESADAAFVYDAADADRAAETLEANANRDPNAASRDVDPSVRLTTRAMEARGMTAAPAPADDGGASPVDGEAKSGAKSGRK